VGLVAGRAMPASPVSPEGLHAHVDQLLRA
jgi:hypothetical protein